MERMLVLHLNLQHLRDQEQIPLKPLCRSFVQSTWLVAFSSLTTLKWRYPKSRPPRWNHHCLRRSATSLLLSLVSPLPLVSLRSRLMYDEAIDPAFSDGVCDKAYEKDRW